MQQAVERWLDEVDPGHLADPKFFLEKAKEEIDELIESSDPSEAADVLICVLAWVQRCEFDAEELIGEKLQVNRERHHFVNNERRLVRLKDGKEH